MLRIGSTFKIKPEQKDEYKKAHDEISPELIKEMKKTGVKNYSIFFHKDGTLFIYFETNLTLSELEKNHETFFKKDISKKWQTEMSKYICEKNIEEGMPKFIELEEVFHLD